jgi:cell division protein FtsL
MPALPALHRPAPQPRAPQRPTLRVVGPVRHTARYVTVSLGLTVLGVIGVVSLSALAAEAAFEARELQAEVSEFSLRYDELTAEVAALESPERIRRVAEEELGMIAPLSPTFLVAEGPGARAGARAQELADRVKPARSE